MAAQARRRPGSPDIEKLEADPEMGMAGIPVKSATPAPKKKEGDVKLYVGQTGLIHPAAQTFMDEYGAVPKVYGRRRRRTTRKRKAGRRKTRK